MELLDDDECFCWIFFWFAKQDIIIRLCCIFGHPDTLTHYSPVLFFYTPWKTPEIIILFHDSSYWKIVESYCIILLNCIYWNVWNINILLMHHICFCFAFVFNYCQNNRSLEPTALCRWSLLKKIDYIILEKQRICSLVVWCNNMLDSIKISFRWLGRDY